MTELLIIAILFILEISYFKIADKYNIIDKPNLRSSHTSITLRGGGIIFLLAAWLYAIVYGINYPWFFAGLTAIAGISFVDDVRSVPNKVRLAVQFTAMFLLFEEFGILSLSYWWMILVALIVCVGIINAYNFMDGINGITGGYSLAVLCPLLYLNQQIESVDTHFMIVIGMSLLVFCFFNFRKRAKCFAGDVGAIGMAFIVLFLLGKLILKTGDITYLLFIAVYGADTILTIVHRIMLHENIGEAHRKHAYQLLANELKLPHVVVSLIYMGLQLIISFGLILSTVNHWAYFAAVVGMLAISYVTFMRKYYYLHELYLKNKSK